MGPGGEQRGLGLIGRGFLPHTESTLHGKGTQHSARREGCTGEDFTVKGPTMGVWEDKCGTWKRELYSKRARHGSVEVRTLQSKDHHRVCGCTSVGHGSEDFTVRGPDMGYGGEDFTVRGPGKGHSSEDFTVKVPDMDGGEDFTVK